MTAIDFEKDQEEVIEKTTNLNKLAEKIKTMQAIQYEIEQEEASLKQKKKNFLS